MEVLSSRLFSLIPSMGERNRQTSPALRFTEQVPARRITGKPWETHAQPQRGGVSPNIPSRPDPLREVERGCAAAGVLHQHISLSDPAFTFSSTDLKTLPEKHLSDSSPVDLSSAAEPSVLRAHHRQPHARLVTQPFVRH